MRAILCLFIFIAVVGAGMSRQLSNAFSKSGEPQAAAVTSPARTASAQQTSGGYRTVKLESDSHGHFKVDARVDGRHIDFMVDTGASAVVLRESAAAQLGIFPRAAEWTGRSQTANGVAKYAPVRLNRVEVNGITVRDVDAAVMADSALKVNLLGMTFLSRVKFTHDRGRLVLEQ